MIFKKLLNNNKVKEIAEQRKVLTETFPYTDWKKVPYTQYNKFLSLKDLIGECGVVWTNAFKRSNTEAEDTRKYLKDYSGNERDIELFNFGWTDGSGYKDGALVGDGVNDYGQCVKDFVLPDDYTVVAMRELSEQYNGPLISKSGQTWKSGAFEFEIEGQSNFSYGVNTVIAYRPKLFSYQTKTSYNGNTLNVGTATDDTNSKLMLFHNNTNAYYKQAALYSFGVFNRTLTAEELALVEDCMYLELEYNTTILDNIEYYDILDARYRSNEEAKDKRNKWNGRLGKLHLTLNNYTYSQKSGWNGYPFEPFNILDYASNSDATESKVKITKLNSTGWICYLTIGASKTNEWRLRVHNPFGKKLYLIYINNTEYIKLVTLNEGINVIPPATEEFTNIAFEMNDFSVGEYIEVEQLPLYPGALVSDGVNDYAVSDETIDEEIGGIVLHAELLGGTYLFAASYTQNSLWGYKYYDFLRLGDAVINDNQISATNIQSDKGVFAYSREPGSVAGNLYIARTANNSNPEWGQNALYQARLIKTQPTDIQLEVIKHQVLMEHNDYVKEMGWE